MRLLKYAILGLIAICLIVIALANRELVTLRLLPGEMAGLLGFSWQITLPLFLIVLASIVIGVIIGEVFEWVREHKHRAEARTMRREKERLEKEVKKERQARGTDDEVLAILEGNSSTR